MLDKVTGWVLCLPDNTTARSEGHVPFLPLQLSSDSRLIRIKPREVCSIFDIFYMFQTSWVHSQDGSKHVEDITQLKNRILVVQLTGTLCYVCKH